ncbi:DUF808 domain-containing protein [Mariniflexile maritimum]|jgi:predicted DNA repair protein MutK|uniref:DUF808 domain-containing protein n=1 Tax=Mariniflexile maritimum TaxID=2682493 RepID=UPI0012F6ABD7|nr:DUF808 domain-containing protein [Mariniflexile maritimum]MCB0449327.1 DUF808 domain-containing protein [Confluentibacter sp.]HMQ44474.1 DUF808 domain-containing protein [Mariniflexile sp.]
MASGFFALLDDIGALMDDVVVMSKITTKKTAGILGDDLAVNAEKATGFVSSRELPVLWAITKGSFLNKLIILPIAFLLSSFLPWAVTLILVLGGVYLAYEGVEKIVHSFGKHKQETKEIKMEPLAEEDVVAAEKKKIKSAIVTDFILSVEIVIIALGTVLGKPILFQVLVVSIVAILATIGVYGIVAMIVRMDDLGFRLIKNSKNKNGFFAGIGHFLVRALPWVIKSLSVIGTIALILVAGGIFTHNIAFLHHFMEMVPSFIKDFIIGLLVGFMALLLFKLLGSIVKMIKK